jgi:hypothetical protein
MIPGNPFKILNFSTLNTVTVSGDLANPNPPAQFKRNAVFIKGIDTMPSVFYMPTAQGVYKWNVLMSGNGQIGQYISNIPNISSVIARGEEVYSSDGTLTFVNGPATNQTDRGAACLLFRSDGTLVSFGISGVTLYNPPSSFNIVTSNATITISGESLVV